MPLAYLLHPAFRPTQQNERLIVPRAFFLVKVPQLSQSTRKTQKYQKIRLFTIAQKQGNG
jgi:hypothetical protein